MRYKKLGRHLRKLRTQAGLSQVDVSTKLGYRSNQFVSNWERGLSYPPMRSLFVLSNLYGIPAESLYGALEKAIVMDVTKNLKESFVNEGCSSNSA